MSIFEDNYVVSWWLRLLNKRLKYDGCMYYNGVKSHRANFEELREDVEGDTTRTRSESENELMRIRHTFLGIRDTNVNFILCQFQRFELGLQKQYFEFLFWNWHRMKFTFVSLIPTKLCLILINCSRTRYSDLVLIQLPNSCGLHVYITWYLEPLIEDHLVFNGWAVVTSRRMILSDVL